jgi:hypothetical protein
MERIIPFPTMVRLVSDWTTGVDVLSQTILEFVNKDKHGWCQCCLMFVTNPHDEWSCACESEDCYYHCLYPCLSWIACFESVECNTCHHIVCGKCQTTCQNCPDITICRSCSHTCGICNATVCAECMKPCLHSMYDYDYASDPRVPLDKRGCKPCRHCQVYVPFAGYWE